MKLVSRVPPLELDLDKIGWGKEEFKKYLLEEERDVYKVWGKDEYLLSAKKREVKE